MSTQNARLTFDEEISAVYIYVQEGIRIAYTIPYQPEGEGRGPIANLDFAENGSLIGAEILNCKIK